MEKRADKILINGILLDEDETIIVTEAIISAFNDGLLSKHYTREILNYNEDKQKELLEKVLSLFIKQK